MTEKDERRKFHKAVDNTLSGLQDDPFLYQRVMAQNEKGEKTVKMKWMKTAMIVMIAALFMGTVALAGGMLGGTVNWLGDVVLDENVPEALPTVAPAMASDDVDLNEDVLDQLTEDGTLLVVMRKMADGTLLPEVSTRMMRTAESMDEFLALLEANEELPLPNFNPEGYEFVRGEVYYECRADGEWRRVYQEEIDGGFIAERYTLDKENEIISGYYLIYRDSPEDYHYLSIDARLTGRQDVQEQHFGFLAGQTAAKVQVSGMDYALARTSDRLCHLSMLRDMKQPIAYLSFREPDWQEREMFEQLDVSVSAPLLDVDTLVRMFAEQ